MIDLVMALASGPAPFPANSVDILLRGSIFNKLICTVEISQFSALMQK